MKLAELLPAIEEKFDLKLLESLEISNITSDSRKVSPSGLFFAIQGEKFDGVRAIWTGDKFITRKGNAINAPSWFTAPLPNVWLDGELWIARTQFSLVSGIVRTKRPSNSDWHAIRYQIFDMPDSTLPFSARYKNYQALVKQINKQHITAVKQHRFTSTAQLTAYFEDLTKQGAEGVMLHLANAKHKSGRSNTLLKRK